LYVSPDSFCRRGLAFRLFLPPSIAPSFFFFPRRAFFFCLETSFPTSFFYSLSQHGLFPIQDLPRSSPPLSCAFLEVFLFFQLERAVHPLLLPNFRPPLPAFPKTFSFPLSPEFPCSFFVTFSPRAKISVLGTALPALNEVTLLVLCRQSFRNPLSLTFTFFYAILSLFSILF